MDNLVFSDPDIIGIRLEASGVVLMLDKASLDDAKDDQGVVSVHLMEDEIEALAAACGEVIGGRHSDGVLVEWTTCNQHALGCMLSTPVDELFVSRADLGLMSGHIKSSRGIPALSSVA